jgi:chloride channel 3/4/5
MTLGEVEQILDQSDHNGFPVIVSTESQYLVGFVLRRDLNLAIKASRNRFEEIPADTIVLFCSHMPHSDGGGHR